MCEIRGLNAAHLRKIQDRKSQTLLEIEDLTYIVGQHQGNKNQNSRPR